MIQPQTNHHEFPMSTQKQSTNCTDSTNSSISEIREISGHAPKISVIVPVYKVEKYLSECIESVLAQTFTDFELILVDDGSPDNSGAICDAYAARDPRIRVFHKENGGVSSARNLGAKHATADYLAFLDSDDWWKPVFLEKMYALTQKFPRAGCCCCCWMSFSEKGGLKSPRFFSGMPLGFFLSVDVIDYAAETDYFPIWTGAILMKKANFFKYGGFDENLVVYEDYKLWFNFCLAGKIPFVNEALSVYRLDSPIANKPRGKIPPLEKHWVSHLHEYGDAEKSRKNVKRYLDRFRLFNLIQYRGISFYKKDVRRILAETSPENWDWKFKIVYTFPTVLGDLLRWLSAIKTKYIFRKNRPNHE